MSHLPGLLTPSQVAPLLGMCPRQVSRLVRDGWFPKGIVLAMGRGRKKERVRLSLQRLMDHGLVTVEAARAAQASP